MIIDAHAHAFAWPKIKKAPDQTPMLSAEQLVELMDSKGIDKAVILQIANAESSMEKQSIGEILYTCEKYPDRFIPFCNIDPRLARKPDMITVDDFLFYLRQYKELGCKGLGELLARLYFDDPVMMKLFEACEKIGFPVTFHSADPTTNYYGVLDDIGLPRLEKVLRTFPNLKMFGHSPGFWSEISKDVTAEDKSRSIPANPAIKPGGRVIELMRKYPNLYGELSALSGYNALTRDPEFAYEFIDEFQDRILFGQDYCSIFEDHRQKQWLTEARDDGKISGDAYEKIMWKNINRVLDLDLE